MHSAHPVFVFILSAIAIGCASSADEAPAGDAGSDTSVAADSSSTDSTVDDGVDAAEVADSAETGEVSIAETATDATDDATSEAASEGGAACSKGTCGSGEICALPAGSCEGGSGTCVTKPGKGSCSSLPDDPVCGCDGSNYTNTCYAYLAGTTVDHAGKCVAATCGNGTCDKGEDCTSCASDCGACACGDGVCTKGTEDCTSCAVDCCSTVCTASSVCPGEGRFCQFAEGACKVTGSTGVCTSAPTSCPPPGAGETVCGCDGSSYVSECVAASAGVSVAHSGLCP